MLVRGGLYEWRSTPGWRLIWKAEGSSTSVAVEESPAGERRLRTNNNFTEGGDAAALGQIRQGMLPTLPVPDAPRVLVLGVGSGVTLAGAGAGLPAAQFDAVGLVPEIRETVRRFARTNGNVADRPNVALHVADARTFAAHAARRGERYDLVVGDVFHAGQAGTGALHATLVPQSAIDNTMRKRNFTQNILEWVRLLFLDDLVHDSPSSRSY
jgi:hypothetical protein